MKKNILSLLLSFACVLGLTADITANLKDYKDACCQFEEKTIADMKRKKHLSERSNFHMAIKKGESVNWSGHVSVDDMQNPNPRSVKSVKGTWKVPHVRATPLEAYTAIWVGIDGYSSPTVEQLGTSHDWINGSAQHSAWFEMYPLPSYEITDFPLKPDDVIQAEVIYKGNDQFKLSMINHTQKVYTVIPAKFTKSKAAKRSSAEWIVEAPYYKKVLPLSNFKEVKFKNCKAKITGVMAGIMHKTRDAVALNMAYSNGMTKSTTTPLNPDRTSFSVMWKHH
jgi:hypothetical protein